MAIIKPFKAYRPQPNLAKHIASYPYDVINSAEAKTLAEGNPYSFLRVVKPEIDVPEGTDVYADAVYLKGKENMQAFIQQGTFFLEETSCYYVYQLEMEGHIQTGLVAAASVEEYFTGRIKIHELTRPIKENDRKQHISLSGIVAEPVFFAYRGVRQINAILQNITQELPLYSFQADDGIYHRLWRISQQAIIDEISMLFEHKVPATYVADGHHRTAAAALVGKERTEKGEDLPGATFFMAVHFPAEELQILDYNRVVTDLGDLSSTALLSELEKHFILIPSQEAVAPSSPYTFGMYLEGKWYSLQLKEDLYPSGDLISQLAVSVLDKYVIHPLLKVTDIRRDKRIDFVGGIRGLSELERRVDSGEMKLAFSIPPVKMDQLLEIADHKQIMPPKSTWFEPKLRSGLLVYSLSESLS
ncbi:MAG: DUF1015 family protein [Bacteroidota bacterium]